MINYLKLAYKLQDKKLMMFNILFITIALLVIFAFNTYSDSASNYIKNDVYQSVWYKSLEIYVTDALTTEEKKELKDTLSDVEHINLVTNFYSYGMYLESDDFTNSKMTGDVYLHVSNNDSLPNVALGENFPDDDGNYLICPNTLYSYSGPLQYISKNDAIKMNNFLGKEVTITYSTYGTGKTYNETFKVIGLYENNSINDAYVCYTTTGALQNIAEISYSDDIDIETGESTIYLQTNLFVMIDDYNNLEQVEDELSSLGIKYTRNAYIIDSYFDNIENTTTYVNYIVILLLSTILIVISYKQYSDSESNYKLLYYLGYHKNDIKILTILSLTLQVFISFILSFIIFGICFEIFRLVLNYYPFLVLGYELCLSYKSLFIIIIIVLITSLISSVINVYRSNKIYE